MPYIGELQNAWDRVVERLGENVPRGTVENMFLPINLESYDGETAVLSVSSENRYTILARKYMPKIRELLTEFLSREVEVEFRYTGGQDYYIKQMAEDFATTEKNPTSVFFHSPTYVEKQEKPRELKLGSSLPTYNYEYTFDNFIVGQTNKFAHAAAVAVAKHPATDYNPLFIYGPSGLGKTHLLYAITNEISSQKPDVNIIYVKGEDFTNQLIESIKDQKTEKFRAKYRSCDVLLIDDIQFIAGKTSTQEEFFHTFNALFEEHKQIILTSDRPPSDIKTLEYRLKTRFEWGLIADIQPPDYELRLAITRQKAEQAGIHVPDDVCVFLAENLRTNFRQIEGSIKKLRALEFLSGNPISMDMARSCIAELLGGAEPVSVTVDKIFSTVYKKYGISKEDICSSKRNKEIATARHITAYLIRNITEMSLPNIGRILDRDYSTIISSIDVVEKKRRTDSIFNVEIEEMEKEINNS